MVLCVKAIILEMLKTAQLNVSIGSKDPMFGFGLSDGLSDTVRVQEVLMNLGQVWYLIVLIPDPCRLSYFGCSSLR